MNNALLQRSATYFLQAIVILVGLGTLAFLLWEPTVEGRNVNATLFQVYFNDPFLLCAYIASIPFFVALYKAFTVLTSIGNNTVFSQDSLRALKIIQYCAAFLATCFIAADVYLMIVRPGDDIAGGVAMGLLGMTISLVMGTAAASFERVLRRGIETESGINR